MKYSVFQRQPLAAIGQKTARAISGMWSFRVGKSVAAGARCGAGEVVN